jgi:hypothetical protein
VYYCHRVTNQLQLTNISISISNLTCSFVPQLATEELRLQKCITCQGNPLTGLFICKDVKGEYHMAFYCQYSVLFCVSYIQSSSAKQHISLLHSSFTHQPFKRRVKSHLPLGVHHIFHVSRIRVNQSILFSNQKYLFEVFCLRNKYFDDPLGCKFVCAFKNSAINIMQRIDKFSSHC